MQQRSYFDSFPPASSALCLPLALSWLRVWCGFIGLFIQEVLHRTLVSKCVLGCL